MAGVAVLAAAATVAALLLRRTSVPELELPAVDPRALFSASYLERAGDYRAGSRSFWAFEQAVQLAAVALVAWRAPALAVRLRRVAGGDARLGALLAVAVVGVAWLATLGPGALRHWWARRFELTGQGFDGWLADRALSLAVAAVLLALAAATVVALARRCGGRWWLPGWLAVVGLAVAFVVVQPFVVAPLFNDHRRLDDPALAGEIARLARATGVELDGVDVADASRRTRVPNASVVGIGPGRRVILDDTLVGADAFGRREVLAVVAHELAHVGRAHVWKGLGWFALLALPATWLVSAVAARRHARGTAEPAAVPLAILVVLVVVVATLPLANAVSRRYEAEADWVALAATDDPAAVERLVVELSRGALGDPAPPGWARQLLGSHPSTVERVAMARAYAALERAVVPSRG